MDGFPWEAILYQPNIDHLSGLLRLCLSVVFGGVIGMERAKHNQAAGVRTHILITLGSCLFMEIGLFLSESPGRAVDPTRIAAQVVSGIGFLGAGAIFRYGLDVKGLTTAASIWAVSAIGLSVGAGMYFLAAGGSLLILFVLHVLEPISHKIAPLKELYTLRIAGPDLQDQFEAIKVLLKQSGLEVEKISLSQRVGDRDCSFSCHLTAHQSFDESAFLSRVTKIPGVRDVNLDSVT